MYHLLADKFVYSHNLSAGQCIDIFKESLHADHCRKSVKGIAKVTDSSPTLISLQPALFPLAQIGESTMEMFLLLRK